MAARRRQRDRAGHVDPFFKRRQRYEAVLRPLGLWESFARLERRVQELLWVRKFPDPALDFDESFPADPRLRKALEHALREACVEINGTRVLARDFFSIIVGLYLALTQSNDLRDLPEEVVEFFRLGRDRLTWCYEQRLTDVLWAIIQQLDTVL